MALQGEIEIDFGAFPGASDASVVVSGVGITTETLAEAWLYPKVTTDHTEDEHWVESIEVKAGRISGAQFTIYAKCTNQVGEPAPTPLYRGSLIQGTTATTIAWRPHSGQGRNFTQDSRAGQHPRIYGKWNCAWVAN